MGDQTATFRLVAAPGLDDGRYLVAIEIAMAPGSHTYWKNPGEAGVPPVFAFNGSQNVSSAQVGFPTPMRISEEGLEAFGYSDRVLFPVTVMPRDPSQPSELHADVTYAVCNKICLPAHSDATLALPAPKSADAQMVAVAFDDVPRPIPDAERGDLQIAPQRGGAKPAWTLTWSGKAPLSDVFADAPEGFYFATKKQGPQSWLLTADQSVTAAKATSVPIALVLAHPNGGSLTVTETLDLGAPKK